MAENVVDALIVTLGLDSSDYQQGMEEAEHTTREFSEKAPREAERGLNMIEAKFGATFRGIFHTFIAPLTAALGTMGIFSSYTQTADRIGKTAARIGASAEDLQAFGEAAKRAGGSVEGFMGAFESLNGQLQRMQAMGGKGRIALILKQLGISATENGQVKDTFQILRELASASERLGKRNFAGLARNLGLDQGTIMLLQSGRVAMDELIARQRALGVYTKEDFEITQKFNDAISDLQQVFRSLAAVILRVIVPPIRMIAEAMTKVIQTFREHQGFIVAGLLVIAGIMSGTLLTAAKALGAALMPLLAPIAAIAALGSVFDEIAVYAEGGETLFEPLWRAIGTPEDFKAALDTITNFADSVWNTISKLAKDIGGAFVDTFSEWASSFDVDAFVEKVSVLWERLKDAFAPLETALKSLDAPIQALKPLLLEIWGLVSDIGKSAMEWLGADEPGGAWDLVKSTIEAISITIQAMSTTAKELFGWIQKILAEFRKFLGLNNPFQENAEKEVLQGRDKNAVISERAAQIKKENPLLTDLQANVAARQQVEKEINFARDKSVFGADALGMAQQGYTGAVQNAPDPTKTANAALSASAGNSWWARWLAGGSSDNGTPVSAVTGKNADTAQISQDNRKTISVKYDTTVNNNNTFNGVENTAAVQNAVSQGSREGTERGLTLAPVNAGVFGS